MLFLRDWVRSLFFLQVRFWQLSFLCILNFLLLTQGSWQLTIDVIFDNRKIYTIWQQSYLEHSCHFLLESAWDQWITQLLLILFCGVHPEVTELNYAIALINFTTSTFTHSAKKYLSICLSSHVMMLSNCLMYSLYNVLTHNQRYPNPVRQRIS